MDAEITYSSSPPLGGHYRPIPPRYGDYRYLPPQRWVHSLVYGALVFLYHPCVSTEDVDDLRNLAKGCLWKHIITPYPHLTRDQPLAIVAHGCVYKMKWVDAEESKKWIIEHALKTDESSVSGDGTYDHDLVTPAAIVSDSLDSNVCLHAHHEHTLTEAPGSVHDRPGEEHNTNSDEHHVNGEGHSTNIEEHNTNDGEHNTNGEEHNTNDEEHTTNGEEHNTNSEEPSTHGEEQNTESPFEVTPDHTLNNMNKTVLAIILAGEKQRAHIVTGVVVVLLGLLVGGIAISIVLHCKYTSRKRQNSQKSYKGFRGFFSSNDPNPAYIPSTGTPKVRGMEKQRLLDSDEEEVM
jgi:hypothetical protein